MAPSLPEDDIAGRILRAARARLFAGGYAALTMDLLAHDLGMSKKTLYAHYAGKEALVAAIVAGLGATIRQETADVLGDRALSYAGRLHGVMAVIGRHLAAVTPGLVRELERFVPAVWAQVEELRRQNVPMVVGGLLQAGIDQGLVRPGLDPDFAVEFWLQSLNGLSHPDVLERLNLTPRAAFDQGIDLLFRAVLTEAAWAEFVATS